ncbi:MAG: ComEC/Rec2 family competence protein [Planctomycetota bacterium]
MTEGRLERAGYAATAGAAAGVWVGLAWGWWVLALALGAGWWLATLQRRQRPGNGRWVTEALCGWLAMAMAMAAWSATREHRLAATGIERWVAAEPSLARVRGRVIDEPAVVRSQRGALGRFSYEPPVTRFELAITAIATDAGWQTASGRVRVRVEEAEPRLSNGDRVELLGWLSGFGGVRNPGEFDYAAAMRARGVGGVLSVSSRGGVAWLGPASAGGLLREPVAVVERWRAGFARACLDSLRLGMAGESVAVERAVASTMLLGVWEETPSGVNDAFRRTGLAHLLSISGAHLGILLGIVWAGLRLVSSRPPRVAAVVLAVLGVYLLAVPWRTPILRASLMAFLLVVAYASGRRVRGLDMMGLAAVLLLLFDPGQVAGAGFQLSFGVVWALLRFTEPTAWWLWGLGERWGLTPYGLEAIERMDGGDLDDGHRHPLPGLWGVGLQTLAASVVATVAAAPLVAYHFDLLTPGGLLLSLAALPVVAGMLSVGYAKLLIGLVLPTGSLLLAGPMVWLTRSLVGLAEAGASTGWAGVLLGRPVGAAWAAAAGVVAVAWLGGAWRGRAVAGWSALALLAGWLVVVQAGGGGGLAERWAVARGEGPTRVRAMSVGEGSCLVVQPGGGAPVWVVDCGARGDWDVGERRVAPALRRIGVGRVGTLVVTHADIDHYNGVLDLADAVPIDRVLTSPQVLAAAAADRDDGRETPLRLLIDGLAERGVPIEAVARGWSETIDASRGSAVTCLWPPADGVFDRDNDASLVLAFDLAGRRVRLNGDIQDAAIEALLASGTDLSADVIDLPHHGALTGASSALLAATAPRVVVQSCGPRRLIDDGWPALLDPLGVERWVTAQAGMVTVRIDSDGSISTTGYAGPLAGGHAALAEEASSE